MGSLFVLQGTQVWTGINAEYFLAWTRSDIRASFIRAFPYLSDKLSPSTPASKYTISIVNGDAAAQAKHLYCPEFWGGSYDAWYIYAYPNISGSIRVNYEIKIFVDI